MSTLFIVFLCFFFFFQAEDGIRDAQESRGLGDVYKRQFFAMPAWLLLLLSGLACVCADDPPILTASSSRNVLYFDTEGSPPSPWPHATTALTMVFRRAAPEPTVSPDLCAMGEGPVGLRTDGKWVGR
eukprot:TRINITY_DN4172_c0_g1_i7.p3 TRINITY_DN4172_c0_g1~~TRINITY_DN4172_c0_g1_i7.p3  ORF type:complete len:128 (+),score=25.73 TRINITY_DN4172_c0_g1_i7:100-483(+)